MVCLNPLETERQRRNRQEVLSELEAELQTLNGHSKRACALFSSRRFGPYLRKLKNGELRINRIAIRDLARRDGIGSSIIFLSDLTAGPAIDTS